MRLQKLAQGGSYLLSVPQSVIVVRFSPHYHLFIRIRILSVIGRWLSTMDNLLSHGFLKQSQ
jgi:hypothetical protein